MTVATVYKNILATCLWTKCVFWYITVAGIQCSFYGLWLNSKCYTEEALIISFQQSWYDASKYCLIRNGSLAVFTDIGRPSDNNQLSAWLNTTGTIFDELPLHSYSYWIGLVRSWWKTTDKGDVLLSSLFSNKKYGLWNVYLPNVVAFNYWSIWL